MSGPGGGSQPQQARLAQALHDFGDATDQAVRAWAGELTMRQALDITYVITDILRLLGTTAERLSRYRAGSEPAPNHDAGPAGGMLRGSSATLTAEGAAAGAPGHGASFRRRATRTFPVMCSAGMSWAGAGWRAGRWRLPGRP